MKGSYLFPSIYYLSRSHWIIKIDVLSLYYILPMCKKCVSFPSVTDVVPSPENKAETSRMTEKTSEEPCQE